MTLTGSQPPQDDRGSRPKDDRGQLVELMRAAANQNSREAYNELVGRLTPALMRAAHRMVQPVYSEDLVQETWYRAWKHRHTYRGDAQPFAWLHTIMAHVAAEDRSLRATANDPSSTDDLASVSSSADFEAFLVGDAIDRALSQLDRREAVIIRRRHLAEQDWATITREMHFASPYHARRIYQQAMRKLIRRAPM